MITTPPGINPFAHTHLLRLHILRIGTRSERLRPALRSVQNTEDFQIVFVDTIRNEVGRPRDDHLPNVGHATQSSKMRMTAKTFDNRNDR